jgi:hypothetical protein
MIAAVRLGGAIAGAVVQGAMDSDASFGCVKRCCRDCAEATLW